MRSAFVSCDWPMCYLGSREDLRIYANSAAEIRSRLVAKGWTRLLGLDICDHHRLEDHVPTLKPEAAGVWAKGVRASCSCGWSDTEKWAPLRSVAIQRWKFHLPEEPNCFEKIVAIRSGFPPPTEEPHNEESPS